MKLAIPNKGRLHEDALELLDAAGLRVRFAAERALLAKTMDGNIEVLLVRARDIPEFIQDGVVDCGITGRDVVAESGIDLVELLALGFGRCRLCLALPREKAVEKPSDLPAGVRIATSFPRLAQQFLDTHKLRGEVVTISGAAEVAPHIGVADAIIDLVSTGSTLTAHGLVEAATLMDSEAVLVARESSLEAGFKGEVVRELAATLDSVLNARGRRYLMANVPANVIEQVHQVLPGISAPTVLTLLDRPDMLAVHAVVPAGETHGIVRALKGLGATGILVMPIERLVP